jgi:protein involved in polysaccharide export with SLBB domain
MGGNAARFSRAIALTAIGMLGIAAPMSVGLAVEPGQTPPPGSVTDSGAAMPGAVPQSPEEIAARLAAQGIPPERIQQMIGEMSTASPELIESEPVSSMPVPKAEDRILAAPGASLSDSAAVDSSHVAAPQKLVAFGYELFEGSPDTYRQPASGPVDPNYPLGPGDQIVVDVWGDTVFRVERELDREGGVNLPDVGRVVLAGMTLEDVRKTLRRRYAGVYSGLSANDARATTHLSVTLGNLRLIRAFVVGRAKRPGGYDLSAASTVFHALFFAGGPTERGSMRSIRLLRQGKEIATLDVYEYLRSGTRQGDVRLENDDTIFIPPTGPRVIVQGQVREPGIYELLPGETLESLVTMSGGFTERAFPGRIQVQRILTLEEQQSTSQDRKVLDFAYDAGGRGQHLQDGDVVTIFEIADRLKNYVTVHGEVRRPGTYELAPGQKLSEILNLSGGLLETAFLDRAEIVRTYEDEHREQIAVDLRPLYGPSAVRAETTTDYLLEPRDEITVYSIWALRDPKRVSVYGAVRMPGSYELRENMTLRDLLLQAGGLQEQAYRAEVEISRVHLGDPKAEQTAQILHVPLGDNYLTGESGDLLLQSYDNVFVREAPYFELQRNVIVTGEVRFPGIYTLSHPKERLSSVIGRAGGLKETAFPDGFTLHRSKDGVGRIALSLKKALNDPQSNDDIILFAGDSLYVPQEPKTVTVQGEIGYPTSLVHVPGWSIGDYIAMAGGTTEKADKGQIRVIYSTGAAARVKRWWFDPSVRPGSTIVVPAKAEKQGTDWGNVMRDTTQILAGLATVVLVVDQLEED